jgi:hypothetical protein
MDRQVAPDVDIEATLLRAGFGFESLEDVGEPVERHAVRVQHLDRVGIGDTLEVAGVLGLQQCGRRRRELLLYSLNFSDRTSSQGMTATSTSAATAPNTGLK